MKKGISYWSFYDAPKLKDALAQAKEAGFETFEPCLDEHGEVSMSSTEEDMKVILGHAQEAGIEIASVATGLYWTYSLTSSDPQTARKAKDITIQMMKAASWLGADTVLVVPGAVDVFFMPESEKLPYDAVYERSMAALKGLAPFAEELGVNIGIENVWNKFLLSPLEMRNFVDEVNSPNVGVYFDTGNVMLTGFPQDWIRILGERIKKVHVKDYKSTGYDGQVGAVDGFCDLTAGEINWLEVVKALDETGYDGPLTAEMVPPTSNIQEENLIQNTSEALDRILGR